MGYARSKNLTTYDVLTIASMIEREARVDTDRPLIAAVIYNRLHLGMTLGIDATLLYEYGSWTHQLTESELTADTPYNTRVRHRPAADADLQPGAGVAGGGRAPGERRLPLLRREGRHGSHYFTEQLPGLPGPWRVSDGSAGGTRLAGVIGWPVEHSRSPQMHNAAYAALGMDWAYVAMPVEPERLDRRCGARPRWGSPG